MKTLQLVKMGMDITASDCEIHNHRMRGVFTHTNGRRVFFEFCTHLYDSKDRKGWLTFFTDLDYCDRDDWENDRECRLLTNDRKRHIKATYDNIFKFIYDITGEKFNKIEFIDHESIRNLY